MLVMGAGGEGLVGRGHTGGDQSCQPTFAKFNSPKIFLVHNCFAIPLLRYFAKWAFKYSK